MAPSKTASPAFIEIGRTGLSQSSGYITEEFLRELSGPRWRKVIREMLANDPVINAMLFAVEMLVRQVKWEVAPAAEDNTAQESAEFFRGALFDDMSSSWEETLSEILSFLPWGWSYHEIVYKKRSGESRDPGEKSKFNDGRIGWRKWPIRAQESLAKWDFDPSGGVQGMIQQAPPTFSTVTIPIEKSLLFRTTSHKNNPEGKSLLRACYRPWYFKQLIENYEGIGIERDLAGVPLMTAPARIMDESAGAEEKAIYEECKRIVTALKANEHGSAVIPSDVYEGTSVPEYSLTLMGTGSRRLFDTDKVIGRKNQEILMRLLADFIILGHEQVGSFALSGDKTNLFGVALGAWLDAKADVINRHAFPRLARLNGMPLAALPKLKHKDIERVDLDALGQYIERITNGGVRLTSDIAAYVVEQAGMPVPDDHGELIGEPSTPGPDGSVNKHG